MTDLILIPQYKKDLGTFNKGDKANFELNITNNSSNNINVACNSRCGCTSFKETSSQKYSKELEPFSQHTIVGTIDTSGMQGRVRKSFDLVYYNSEIKDVISTNIPFELTIL